jgi:4-amino-4-deoxy-L-arabinose transferase-like glycosyltransferase
MLVFNWKITCLKGIRIMMEDTRNTGTYGGRIAALVAVAAFAAALRFFRLGHQSFWLDEVLTIGSYTTPEGGIPYGVKLLWDVHGPLYSLAMHFWSIASSSEAWLRAPGAAAGIVTVILVYFWLRRESGEATALAGALLMAVNPFNVYYSQELRFYSFLTMFIVLSLLVFSRFDERPSFRRGLLLGLVLGLACLSHFMAVFLCMGLALYMAVTGKLRGDHLRYGALAALVAIVIVSPWIYRELFFIRRIWAVEESSRPVVYRMEGSGPSALMAYPYALFAFVMGFSYGPDLRELHEVTSVTSLIGRYGLEIGLASLLFGASAVAGTVRLVKERRAALYICVLAASIGSVTLAAILKIKVLNARYLMCAFPVFIALIAHGIPRARAAAISAASLLSVLMLYSVIQYHFNPRYARDDIRGAVEIISAAELPGDVILAPGMSPVVRHYYRGARPVESVYAAHLDRDGVREKILRMTEGRRRVWLLICRPWDTDAEGNISQELEDSMIRSAEYSLPGVMLVLYEARQGLH